jgi:hypothetical protein
MNHLKLKTAMSFVASSLVVVGVAACASTSAAESDDAEPAVEPVAEAAEESAEEPAEVVAVAPDREKFVKHSQEHVTYPLDRAGVLQACAATPEFTEAEKSWVADKLPEGEYSSSEEVISALGL